MESTKRISEGSCPLDENTLDVLGELVQGLATGGTRGELWSKTRVNNRDGELPEALNDTFVIPPAVYQDLDLVYLQQIVPSIESDGVINLVNDGNGMFIPLMVLYGDLELHLCNSPGNANVRQETRLIGKYLDNSLMSGSVTMEARSLGKPSLEGEHKTDRRKCIKKMPKPISLGSKTRLNNAMELEEKAVIGHFPGKKMSCEYLKDWTRLNFEPLMGYVPCIMTMERDGWSGLLIQLER